jgi:hypothetical protein
LIFYTTGDIDSFKDKAKIFIKDLDIKVEKVTI